MIYGKTLLCHDALIRLSKYMCFSMSLKMFLSSACYKHDREVNSKVTEPHKGKRDPRRLSEF